VRAGSDSTCQWLSPVTRLISAFGICFTTRHTDRVDVQPGKMAELDNRGHWLASAMMLTWSWSTLMYIVRVWAKLQVRRWGAEDYTVTAAFVCGCAFDLFFFSAVAVGRWLMYIGSLCRPCRSRPHIGRSRQDMVCHLTRLRRLIGTLFCGFV
jgi:hypothetical protein